MTLAEESMEQKTTPAQTITLKLPGAVYERAKETAQSVNRPLEDVLVQSIALALPPLEEDIPSPLRMELSALSLLGDEALQAIAHSRMDSEQQAELEALAEAQKHRPLTSDEQTTLADLLSEAERVMLRKAEAYRLLAQRGYDVFPASQKASR